ncbi:MAG: protein-methionine-sulfoxide reductase catalytic subunit MsrP [Thiotrichaceae bacterium]|nr:protein-methionine-sulfoxide reductase catalytic subunit MsrP [Thiotrichaceae bacterium]
MKITKTNYALKESEVTEESLYLDRRQFIKKLGYGTVLLGTSIITPSLAKKSTKSLKEELTDYKSITQYNNFYEFGTNKLAPYENAHTLKTTPWNIIVEGECEKPGNYSLEKILKGMTIEERIYRFRCVEGWSMVIPWNGFSLASLLKRFQPTSKAKYVYFETLHDPENMPNQQQDHLEWPYIEGLRIDEAMNPLTLLATGLYGKDLPNQNGAPLRLVVPWKYGFKSIKSIAKIRFLETQLESSWQKANKVEYGFYSNVNPNVNHPRWSQSRERRIGKYRKRKTLMFNGYAEEVAHLYKGMDLKQNY